MRLIDAYALAEKYGFKRYQYINKYYKSHERKARLEEHTLYYEALLRTPTVNAIVTPEGATNGEIQKIASPQIEWELNVLSDAVEGYIDGAYVCQFDLNWWNAPYERK